MNRSSRLTTQCAVLFDYSSYNSATCSYSTASTLRRPIFLQAPYRPTPFPILYQWLHHVSFSHPFRAAAMSHLSLPVASSWRSYQHNARISNGIRVAALLSCFWMSFECHFIPLQAEEVVTPEPQPPPPQCLEAIPHLSTLHSTSASLPSHSAFYGLSLIPHCLLSYTPALRFFDALHHGVVDLLLLTVLSPLPFFPFPPLLPHRSLLHSPIRSPMALIASPSPPFFPSPPPHSPPRVGSRGRPPSTGPPPLRRLTLAPLFLLSFVRC